MTETYTIAFLNQAVAGLLNQVVLPGLSHVDLYSTKLSLNRVTFVKRWECRGGRGGRAESWTLEAILLSCGVIKFSHTKRLMETKLDIDLASEIFLFANKNLKSNAFGVSLAE